MDDTISGLPCNSMISYTHALGPFDLQVRPFDFQSLLVCCTYDVIACRVPLELHTRGIGLQCRPIPRV